MAEEEYGFSASESHADTTEPPRHEAPRPETTEAVKQPEPSEEQHESGSKGMLRAAIQKVMEEITYHEREAQRHLQQAKELRRDLRESFDFLQERGEESEPLAIPSESRTSETVEPETKAKTKDVAAVSKPGRATAKRKASGGKSKER